MSDIEASLTAESKSSLLLRVTLLTAFQQLLCLALAISVHLCPFLASWLESNLWLLAADIALAVFIVVLFELVSYQFTVHQFQGFVGVALMLLFMPSIALLFGGYLPMLISTESFVIGMGLLTTVTTMGCIYLIWQKPVDFKAHVVIPVGMMVSLALYGGLLIVFHSEMTGHLMLWTFIEGAYIIYFSLDLQDINQDSSLGAADYVAGTIRIYSDVAVYVVGMFQNKSVGKGK